MDGRISDKEPEVTSTELSRKTFRPRRNWKPFAIHLPYLISLSLYCLLLIVILEVLLRNANPLDKSVFDQPTKRDGISPLQYRYASGSMPMDDCCSTTMGPPMSTKATSSSVITTTTTSKSLVGTVGPPTYTWITTTATCTTTSTVYATAVVFVSGTLTRASLITGTSRSCVTTSTLTITSLYSTTKSSSYSSKTATPTPALSSSFLRTSASQFIATVPTLPTPSKPPTSSFTPWHSPTVLPPTNNISIPPTPSSDSVATTVAPASSYIQTYPSLPPSRSPTTNAVYITTTATSANAPATGYIQTYPSLPPNQSPTTRPVYITTTAISTDAPATNYIQTYPSIPSNGRLTTTAVYITTTATSAVAPASSYILTYSALAENPSQTANKVLTTSLSQTSLPIVLTTITTTSLGTAQPGQSTLTTVSTSSAQATTSTTVTISTTSQYPQPTGTSVLQQFRDVRRPDLLLTANYTTERYFGALYLPSMAALLLKASWSLTASGLKMVEPFYQLNRPDGANARESLLEDYLGGTNSINTFARALKGSVLCITLIFVSCVIDLLAPISTGAVSVIPLAHGRDENGIMQAYRPSVVLNWLLIRIMQSMLSFVVVVVAWIAILDRRRRSNLSANPSKLATMASMINHPNMVHDIRQLNPNASTKEIEAAIAHNRYKITSYQDHDGSCLVGLVKQGEATPQGIHRVPVEELPTDDTNDPTRSIDPASVGKNERCRPERRVWYRVADALLMFLLIGLLATVVAWWLDNSQSEFRKFFNSDQFAPRFILSLGASITTTTFQSFEREVRLITPYRLLARRDASSRDTVLRSTNGTETTGLTQSVQHRTPFAGFVALTTLFGNILIIMITGVPYSPGESLEAFLISASISVTIIVIMLVASISVFFWRRKNKQLGIPPEPNDTLLKVWMSMSNSDNQLRAILNESGDMSGTSMRARIKGDGGRYWAGWVLDAHGRARWTVDRESISANFNDHNAPVVQTARLESNPTQTAHQASRIAQRRGGRGEEREDLSQTFPLIQTEYRGEPIRRPEERQRPRYQEAPAGRRIPVDASYPFVQTEFTDHPIPQEAVAGQYQRSQWRHRHQEQDRH